MQSKHFVYWIVKLQSYIVLGTIIIKIENMFWANFAFHFTWVHLLNKILNVLYLIETWLLSRCPQEIQDTAYCVETVVL